MESSKNPSNRGSIDFVPPALLLSLATAPVLLGLVGSKIVAETIRDLSLLSEELLRGDRLPVLKFPTAAESDPENEDLIERDS